MHRQSNDPNSAETNQQAVRSLNLTQLPSDVLRLIAYRLSPHDIAALSATSRKLHASLTSRKDSPLWRAKLTQHFPQAAAKLLNQPVNQSDFAAAYLQDYGNLDARTRYLFTLAAEGDVTRLRDGSSLYAQPRYPRAPIRIQKAKTRQAPISLHEITAWHFVGDGMSIIAQVFSRHVRQSIVVWSVALIAIRQAHQSILDHGYSLAQRRFSKLRAELVTTPLYADGWQLIHAAAALNQSEDTICALLAAGAEVNAALQCGKTPLFIAAQNGHMACVEILLANGAHVDAANHYDETPLFTAAQQGHTASVEALLANGAHVDAAKFNGATPLFIAAQEGHTTCVEALLANGASVAAKLDGTTPLYIAAENGHTACVEALLANGANAEWNVETSFSIAIVGGHYHTALHLYIHAIESREDHHYLYAVSLFGRTFTGVGKSAGEKKAAAQALLKVVEGKAAPESLEPHAASLSNGKLGIIAKGLEKYPLMKRGENRLINALKSSWDFR